MSEPIWMIVADRYSGEDPQESDSHAGDRLTFIADENYGKRLVRIERPTRPLPAERDSVVLVTNDMSRNWLAWRAADASWDVLNGRGEAERMTDSELLALGSWEAMVVEHDGEHVDHLGNSWPQKDVLDPRPWETDGTGTRYRTRPVFTADIGVRWNPRPEYVQDELAYRWRETDAD